MNGAGSLAEHDPACPCQRRSMNQFKVWHVPQVPMKAFEVETETLKEADLIRDVLAQYDLFQFENNVKGDYSNASGISEWVEEDQEWFDCDEHDIDAALDRL